MLVEQWRGKERRRQEGKGRERRREVQQRNGAEAPFARCSGTTTLGHIDFTGLHSHSVDPFTEGMSHTLSSSPSPPSFPRRILSSPHRTPARWLCYSPSPPTNPVSVSHECFSFYLIPSIPLLHPSSPTSTPLPRDPSLSCLSFSPPPFSFSLSLSPFLSRSLVYSTKVSLFLSDSVV